MTIVVTMTIATTAEKVSGPITGCAVEGESRAHTGEDEPDLPLGTIPIPTAMRLTPVDVTPNAHTCFPTMAATINAAASPRTPGSANVPIRLDAHQHEEHGNQHIRDRPQQLSERAFTAVHEVLEVYVFEYEARGKCADDRGQANQARRPRQQEAQAQAHADQHASHMKE